MRFFRHLPIARKLTAITVLISCASLLIAFAVFGIYDRSVFRADTARSFAIVADEFDNNLDAGLAFADVPALELTLQSLEANPHILAAGVYDAAGALVASYRRAGLPAAFAFPTAERTGQHFLEERLDTFQDVTLKGERLGTFYIGSDLRAFEERTWRYLAMTGGLLTACALMALLLAHRLQRIISGPIIALAATAELVAAQEDYSLRAAKQGDDEVGKLVDGFNNMLAQVQARDGALHSANAHLEQRVAERTAELAETSGLLEAMLESSPDLIYFKDRNSAFVRFSQACLPRLGLTEAAMLRGKTDADFFDPNHAQQALADEREIIRTGQPIIGKLEREIHAGNRVGWVLTTKMPWRSATGEIVGTFGISKDVTAWKEAEAGLETEIAERRRSETALRESQQLIEGILNAIPMGVFWKDRNLVFLGCNAVFARDAGFAGPKDVIGKDDTQMGWRDQAELYRAGDRQILESGASKLLVEEPQTTSAGDIVTMLASKVPLRSATGGIYGVLGTYLDITERKKTEKKLELVHRELLVTSRLAGMAEVATGVLHNVGNVLNSVNVSATLVADRVRHSKSGNIAKISAIFAQHQTDLAAFLTADTRGRMIPSYLGTLAEELAAENLAIATELDLLRKNLEHIKEIVAMQQTYARTSGVIETVSLPDLIEDALRINSGSLSRHEVQTLRDYQARPVVTIDKHKVIQILINLVRNAKYACDEAGNTDKKITVRTTGDDDGIDIAVIDNGVGIPAENLTRIFNHGFTTRKSGHGFGLHSAALAAKELGGSLQAQSGGPGMGATFVLRLPYAPKGAKP